MALADYESFIEEARMAVVDVLAADDTWQAAFGNGTTVAFRQTELLQRLEIEPRLCPILAVFPSTWTPRDPFGDDNDDEHLDLGIQIVDTSDRLARAEKLVTSMRTALAAAFRTIFRGELRDGTCTVLTLTDCEFQFYPTKEAARSLVEITTELGIGYGF